jgi:hypothetical protein
MMMREIKNDLPIFEYKKNIINIKGKSIPEDAKEAWLPFINRINEIIKEEKQITINFNLDIFNTASSLYLNNIFLILENNRHNVDITINWYYLGIDEDMFDLGEIYSERYKLKFNLIKK